MRKPKTYWRIGGSPSTVVPLPKAEQKRHRKLTAKLYREQVRDFRGYWGEAPRADTKRIFLNRAKIDASVFLHNRHIDRLERRALRSRTRGSR